MDEQQTTNPIEGEVITDYSKDVVIRTVEKEIEEERFIGHKYI